MKKYTNWEDLPLVLRIEDLMALLDIGRNSAYALVNSGTIQCIRVGNLVRIPRQCDGLPEYENLGVKENEGTVASRRPSPLNPPDKAAGFRYPKYVKIGFCLLV